MRPIRVLVVDDSPSMRVVISRALGKDPDVEVVGEASDALEACQAIPVLNPDVITLDILMPHMTGLEFLEWVMRHRPVPVVMVSKLTLDGASATIRALELGAIDCVAKPAPEDPHSFDQLRAKVKMAARCSLGAGRLHRVEPTLRPQVPRPQFDGSVSECRVVVIGSSTGGVEALMSVLTEFPANCPPTLITQHMPAPFTRSFAERLDRLCSPRVSEATDGAPIQSGCVYLAPGGGQHLEIARNRGLRCRLRSGDLVNGHRPSVDVLFRSAADAVGRDAIGAILTGMGRDGASGLLAMRQAGARTLGQDEQTCVIYGMPRVAFEVGAVEKQLPLHRIAKEILGTASRRTGPRAGRRVSR
jgi:two-component system chemotaxis response regulator CheB